MSRLLPRYTQTTSTDTTGAPHSVTYSTQGKPLPDTHKRATSPHRSAHTRFSAFTTHELQHILAALAGSRLSNHTTTQTLTDEADDELTTKINNAINSRTIIYNSNT